jgi:two-component system cell cycle response regulator DivK
VADDHEDSRTIARLILETAGFRVIEARTGYEALALARAESPAVILLDIVMPGLDGWTAARQLRREPSMADTAIVALTALAGDADRERALAAGCDEVLTKPTRPRALLELVLRYTRSRRAPVTQR